jgi:hypothetical protein
VFKPLCLSPIGLIYTYTHPGWTQHILPFDYIWPTTRTIKENVVIHPHPSDPAVTSVCSLIFGFICSVLALLSELQTYQIANFLSTEITISFSILGPH